MTWKFLMIFGQGVDLMEYNWPVGLYWDCFGAQWGRDTTRKITEACIFVTGRV